MNDEYSIFETFAKALIPKKKISDDSNIGLYGTVYVDKSTGKKYVDLDGSSNRTPIYEAMDAENGDRVITSIKDHKLVLTGNLSSPASARKATGVSKPVNVGSMIGNLSDSGDPNGTYIIFQEDSALICEKNDSVNSRVLAKISFSDFDIKVNEPSCFKINGKPFTEYIEDAVTENVSQTKEAVYWTMSMKYQNGNCSETDTTETTRFVTHFRSHYLVEYFFSFTFNKLLTKDLRIIVTPIMVHDNGLITIMDQSTELVIPKNIITTVGQHIRLNFVKQFWNASGEWRPSLHFRNNLQLNNGGDLVGNDFQTTISLNALEL